MQQGDYAGAEPLPQAVAALARHRPARTRPTRTTTSAPRSPQLGQLRRSAPAPRALAAAPGQPDRDPRGGEALPTHGRSRATGKDQGRLKVSLDAAVRILVTGAAGFIGSNFVRHWLEQHPGDRVVALDLLTYAGNRANLADGGPCPFVQARHRRPRPRRATSCASTRSTSSSTSRPSRTTASRSSIRAGFFAHERARHAAAARGGAPGRGRALPPRLHLRGLRRPAARLGRAFTEDSPYRPRTPYNASKAGADHFVRAYHETFGLPITITNCSNNYGPFQFPEKVIPLFTTHALDDQPLPLYASTQNQREWLHVLDHCRAIELVLDARRAGRDVQRRLGRRGVDRGDRRPRARADRASRSR